MSKALIEKRNALLNKLDELVAKAETETRAFNEDEQEEYESTVEEVKKIDKTLSSLKESRSLEKLEPQMEESKEKIEERAFTNFLKGVVETRADANLTLVDNKAVIPSSIANKIIEKVVEISPIYSMATRYNVKGNLSIPYYDENTQKIEMAYAEEFVDLTSTAGKFASIQLTGHLAGVLSKISLMLINNSQFDIVGYTINKMAKSIAKWIEKELLFGTDSKIEGLRGIKQTVTITGTAISTDNLIDVQEEVPDVYQSGAIWLMSRKTRTAIRKLKDNEGNYILNRDITGKWNYMLLGKPVIITDNMPNAGAGSSSIIYGDMSGLAIKIAEDINIAILKEHFALQHVVGVVGWLEIDAKVEDTQKLSKLIHE